MAQDHFPAELSNEQRANLTKLAAYLRTLPVDYPDFEMSAFTADEGEGEADSKAYVAACGTAACAAGHGPIAGIKPLPCETWWDYSHRAFAAGPSWSWCFSGIWADVDNSIHGAAARIEHLLLEGLPSDWAKQQLGAAPLSYSQVSA